MPRARAIGKPELLTQLHRDDPRRGVRIEMEGTDAPTMIAAAKVVAADFLGEPLMNLFVADTSNAVPSRWRRFRPNLSMDNPPIRWRMSCTIRLAPEVIDERRELRRERSKNEDDRPDGDVDDASV